MKKTFIAICVMALALTSCYASPNGRLTPETQRLGSCAVNNENINFSKMREITQIPFNFIEFRTSDSATLVPRSYVIDLSVVQNSYGELHYRFSSPARWNGSIILREVEFTDYVYFEDTGILRIF